MTQVLGLGGVILLGAMSPGPDFVIVTRSAALSGRRAGMACAAGIGAGVFAWSAVTALWAADRPWRANRRAEQLIAL